MKSKLIKVGVGLFAILIVLSAIVLIILHYDGFFEEAETIVTEDVSLQEPIEDEVPELVSQENPLVLVALETGEINRENQIKIHDFVNELLNEEEYYSIIRTLEFFTDGPDEVLAEVEPVNDSLESWTLKIDYEDVFDENNDFSVDFIQTIHHEYAHIASLNNTQVDVDYNVCETFEVSEGCLREDSYLYSYIAEFWTDEQIDYLFELENNCQEDDLSYCGIDVALNQAYPGEFVSEYAASNPGEDFAEAYSFARTGNTAEGEISQDKIEFFK